MQTAEAAATRAARDGSIATACRLMPKKDRREKIRDSVVPALKSGQAVTGVHLLITYKTQDFECWYCSNSKRGVAHVPLQCHTRRNVRCRVERAEISEYLHSSKTGRE